MLCVSVTAVERPSGLIVGVASAEGAASNPATMAARAAAEATPVKIFARRAGRKRLVILVLRVLLVLGVIRPL